MPCQLDGSGNPDQKIKDALNEAMEKDDSKGHIRVVRRAQLVKQLYQEFGRESPPMSIMPDGVPQVSSSTDFDLTPSLTPITRASDTLPPVTIRSGTSMRTTQSMGPRR